VVSFRFFAEASGRSRVRAKGDWIKGMDKSLNGRMVKIVEELVRRGLPLDQGVREFERQYIAASLRRHDGNLTRSAQALGVHRNTLRNKVSSLEMGRKPRAPRGKSRRAR
jgi:DNA-binding NtrC family response regulator